VQIRFACGLDLQSRAGFWKNEVPLITRQLLFEIFWELFAYHHPMPQCQPHSAHKPYGPSFTGFKTSSRNVQRFGLLYRLLVKKIINHKQSSLAPSISGNCPFLGPVNFLHDASHPLIAALCFRHSRMLLS
jgi:hypothetical protein